jgi:predicted nucleic acid-binding protein
MVLVDTSVWIDHLRKGNPRLEALLGEGEVLCHPFVIGELACGHIVNRRQILAFLNSLPQVVAADHDEVMRLIDANQLMGTGIGYLDAHLLASARLSSVPIWTFDVSLSKTSAKLLGAYTQ